jgi:PelA/Pel-15E family pectate lyase
VFVRLNFSLCFILALPALLAGAVVGTNPPSLPLTAERIAQLPAAVQPEWREYLERSTALRAADQKFLADEITAHAIKATVPVTQNRAAPRFTGRHPSEWFASAEARQLADNVVSFQTSAGGWSKNFNTADHRRQPGEAFSPDTNLSKFLTPGDNDQPHDVHWSYIGTFDNNATIGELRFLAKVAAAADEKTGAPWRAAFVKGLNYVLTAQYPNGGWPQIFPLDGGYHDAITFNDGAITNIIEFVRDTGAGNNEFAWVSADLRRRAAASEARGIACILACQLVVDGRRTVWCQQHDMLTLAPTSARNYEMPSQSGSESAGLAIALMALSDPSPDIVRAVHAAAQWFEKTALRDVAFTRAPDGSGRKLLPAPGADPIWARYYELKTDRPLFGDRDKSIHDDLNEISAERRNGYSWFNNAPQRALDRYTTWAKIHPQR